MGHLSTSPKKSYFVSTVWCPISKSYKYKLNIIVDFINTCTNKENHDKKLIDFKKKLLTFINL